MLMRIIKTPCYLFFETHLFKEKISRGYIDDGFIYRENYFVVGHFVIINDRTNRFH